VELVHCYSLVHDDLPAMDDDDFRRGKPSNHKVYGEATAILTGDALLTLAFEWLAEAAEQSRHPQNFIRAVLALARGAGISGMVRGQARDLGEAAPRELAELENLHAEKTAALFKAALEVGAAAAGAQPPEIEALGRFGWAFGVAFQHADDLDDGEHLAHATGARQRVPLLLSRAVAALDPLPQPGQAAVLRALAGQLLTNFRTSTESPPSDR
jgi:geranylgeranyl diphosphate synthase, type II